MDELPFPPPPAPPVPSALAWAPAGAFLGLGSAGPGVSYSPGALLGAYWPWIAGAGVLVLAVVVSRR